MPFGVITYMQQSYRARSFPPSWNEPRSWLGGVSPPPWQTHAVDQETFLQTIERRLAERVRRGTVANVEIVGPQAEFIVARQGISPQPEFDHLELSSHIDAQLNPGDLFCWCGGRFLVFIELSSAATRTLSQISRGIAGREWDISGLKVHLTPIVGYVALRKANSPRELWEMADNALLRATSSLDVEPFQYVAKKELRPASQFRPSPGSLWRRLPQWLVLSIQLFMSLVVGLGGPFVLYAVCDALGADISGAVYVGVVVVLVITATTIWIEGLLALRPTTPPFEPGEAYPMATLIIPAYLPNESTTIMETLRAFLQLSYNNTVQIIVAYNCPAPYLPVEDEMRALAGEYADGGRFLIEPVRVAKSTSKAQNVNAVVGRIRGRFVGIFDADHHPHADSLERAWRWLSNGWDIVQGRCSIRNGEDSWVARMVAVEFEQIYAVSHPGRARFHGFGIFGGSNGFWRTSVLHEIRMRHSMLTEDIDSSIRAVVAGYKITGDRDLISEELAPTNMNQLLNQRLRWAQGWFQVSFRRVLPALMSPHVTFRQKLGLIHLLVWRELFPWYSIQVVPILIYWVWVYGWSYLHWAVPIFLATTIFTFSTGPVQIILAYKLAQKPMRNRLGWFIEYFFVSTFFYSPFKDALSRIAHVKEAMREKTWKVTPRVQSARTQPGWLARALAPVLLMVLVIPADRAHGATPAAPSVREMIGALLGGEATTINAARVAVRERRNGDAAQLFAKAIYAVPSRRRELLREYADALNYSGRSAQAVPLYRELLSAQRDGAQRRDIGKALALALTWSNDHSAALAVYDRLLAMSPGDADLAIHRARSLVSVGRIDDAVVALYKVPSVQWTNGPLAKLAAEVLIEGARAKRKAGQNEVAVALFSRAIKTDDRLRASLQREVRAAATPSSRTERIAAPKLHPVIATNDESNERQDRFNALVARARVTARADRNAESARLFADAMKAEPSRRDTIIREYADQLTFSGRAPQASMVYLKVTKRKAVSQIERKQALLGLARSYAWSHRPKDAARIYQQTADAYPADVNLHWTILVETARYAALSDKNSEAAQLFAKATTLNAARSGEIRREYADQLSYSGHADQSVPLFREVLKQINLNAKDRLSAQTGLAQAYEWSGQTNLAKAVYQELLSAKPSDSSLQWKILIVAARDAAHNDRNREAATLFARAIKLDYQRSIDILGEYADQLSYTDRAESAIGFYDVALNRPGLLANDETALRVRLARANDWAGHYTDAQRIYSALLSGDPRNTELRWHLLVVSARAAAAQDRNKEAAQMFAQAIKLRPEWRLGILKDYADKLVFSGQKKPGIELYREALKQPLAPAAMRDTSLALAQALAWDHQFDDSLVVYAKLIGLDPTDADASLGSARTLSWAGHQARAAEAYNEILRRDPDNGEAQRGLAEAEDWDGHHRAAQVLLQRRLASHPTDLEARRLLAQSLVWSGRSDLALEEVHRALQYERRPVRRHVSEPLVTKLSLASTSEASKSMGLLASAGADAVSFVGRDR